MTNVRMKVIFSVFGIVHVLEIISLPRVYHSVCLTNQALNVKSVVQTIS